MFWQNHPLIRLIIPFTLGMIVANLFIRHMSMTVLFILCCVVLAFSFFYLGTSNTYQDGKFGIVAMTLFFLIGMTLYTGKHQRITRGVPTDTTFCQGILSEVPIEKNRSWTLNLQQDNDTHIILYIGKNWEKPQHDSIAYASLQLGDTILANIKHLERTGHGGGRFKAFSQYLFHHGICATAYAPHGQWQVKPCKNRRSITLFAKDIQTNLHHIYKENGLNQEVSNIIEAMSIGRKTDIPKATRNAYTYAGVSHILALSGFHVGIIALMIQAFFFKKLLPLRWRWVSNVGIIASLWCYTLITGMSPSLVRATLMFTILLLCQSTFRNSPSTTSCAVAFFIMLCINPFYLHDIGFQLSFIAVASIGVLGRKLITLFSFQNNWAYYAWFITIIAISLISTTFTAPLVAYYFGHISTLALLSNLLLFPFVYLLMFASILWWTFLWYTPINTLLTDLLNWTATTMNSIVESIASLPYATLKWHPSLLTTILCYSILLTLTYFFTHKKQAL